MRAARLLLGVLGAAVAAYGVKLLLDLGSGNLVATVEWAVGGVVLHDGVLAPLTILVGGAFVRLSRAGRWTGPLMVAAIVVSTVTIAAIPVLGHFGARSDNATLLDRNYLAGWLIFVGLTAAVTIALLLVRGRQRP